MRSFKIKKLKHFMNQLLLADTFDYFSVSKASVTTFVTFTIDGSLHPDFYDPDTAARLKAAGKSQVRWSGIKSWCYSVIRGKRTPISFRFIFIRALRSLRFSGGTGKCFRTLSQYSVQQCLAHRHDRHLPKDFYAGQNTGTCL